MIKTYLISLFNLLVLLSAIGQTDTSRSEKSFEIQKLVRTYSEYGTFNGAILVAEEGQVLYKEAFGLANMEWDVPNQVDTKFRLASVTKQFTAMLIMQLVAEGMLDLNVPISTYLPDYPNEVAQNVNIHHLLSHTSGIPNYTSFPGYQDMMGTFYEPNELVAIFADSTLLFDPGERFDYSNSGYVLLGHILEKITGKTFERVLHEKILSPLGMKNTGYEIKGNIVKNRAVGYYRNLGAHSNSHPINMSVGFTAGGLYSTVEDLFLWEQALYTESLLPQKYLDMIFSKHIPAWGGDYGYGWNIGSTRIGNIEEQIATIYHDGVINGFNSYVVRFPSSKSSIILLNNTGNAPLYDIIKAITGILHNKSYDLPKESAASSMYDVIIKSGIEKGIEHFNRIKNNSNYNVSEREMNMLSYELLNADRANDAADVLNVAIQALPNRFNLYDSYGEVLRILGDKELAIDNYKKSVQLNPKNENGIKMLAELGVKIDETDLWLLQSDESWSKEIFILPLHFAPDLKYTGKEEAHFPQGWRNQESPEFWSYIIAWEVDALNAPIKSDIEKNLQIYFEGLLNLVNKDKSRTLPKMIAAINKLGNKNDVYSYSGWINIFDTFVTNEIMKLNVTVESSYCTQNEKATLIFRFSPKDFNHQVWQTLEEIGHKKSVCH